MAGVGFLRCLWEKPIWEGVWPYLDPMDSVCLRTASKAWNVPGNYGPHGELFFLQVQKELALPGTHCFFKHLLMRSFLGSDVNNF